MTLSRRKFLKTSAATAAALAFWQMQSRKAEAADAPDAGPFQPSLESLKQYRTPQWFQDAKFGIFMHWGPTSLPGVDGWYGRGMYQQGSDTYKYHLAHFGHPSQVGYKDVCKRFQPAKFDAAQADRLVKLYKQAGARYIVPVAVHHDNFDMWDSTYQPRWNVKATTGKDVVGMWKKAASDNGLRFGVSTHVARTYRWFQPSHGADNDGPLKGVPYDGQNPAFSDLYGVPFPSDSTDYDQMSDVAPPQWEHEYEKRMLDLIDKYHPDLYYEDGGIPFHVYPAGLNILAHYYNQSIRLHHGRLEAVAAIKLDWQADIAVQDYEGTPAGGLAKYPWQSDKALNGGWFWDRHDDPTHFPGANKIVATLIDNVSRNGNLLLNVQLRPDGTLEDAVVRILEDLGLCTGVVGEAIFGTRPWKIAAEGDGRLIDFNEGTDVGLTETDFRFTTKGNTLYATAFGWPANGKLIVRTLSADPQKLAGSIQKVSLLGCAEKLTWAQTDEGLVVTLPAQKPGDYVYSLKIEGLNLAASRPVPPAVQASADGSITLKPQAAQTQGAVHAQNAAVPNLGAWDNPQDTVFWNVCFDAPGTYVITTKVSTGAGPTAFIIEAGAGASAPVQVPDTGGWDNYKDITGVIKVAAAGDHLVTVRPADPAAWKPMNLAALTLTRSGN